MIMDQDCFYLYIKVVVKSKKNKIIGWEGDSLKIKIKEAPEKNKANLELIKFLAKKLKIAPSNVLIVAGHKNKKKKILIKNLDFNKIKDLLI